LRRSEAVQLRFEDVQRQPVGEKERAVLQVSGKGAKDRVIPISEQLAEAISAWGDAVGSEGRILRSLGRDRGAF
jgi:site-specific recombinase XerD